MKKNPPGSFYRHILRDAWEITKTRKRLWIFGFFVSFLGAGGVYELLVQGTGRLGLTQDFGSYLALSALVPSGPEFVSALKDLGGYNTAFLAVTGIGALALFAVAVWAVISSQGALILGVRDAKKGRKTRFSRDFAGGSEAFPPLFLLNLLARFAIAASFYLILSLMLLLLSKATLVTSLLYLIAFLILMPFTLIIGFITVYAAAYIVLHRMRLIEAVETALALFRKYWLISLETAVILFGINIAVSLGIGLVFSFLAVLLLPLIVGASLVGANLGLWTVLVLAAAAALLTLVAVSAWLTTFQYATWTLVFLRLHSHGRTAAAKVMRLFEGFLK